MLNQILIPLQKFLVANRNLILNSLFALELALGLLWIVVVVFMKQEILPFETIYDLGKKFGQISLVWYLLSLAPGIISRLKLMPLLGTSLMLFRRQFGVLMFITAFLHYSFTTFLPIVLLGFPPILSTFQFMGLIAFFATFPLWLTSNDASERFLGRKWKMLHKLAYVILFFVFMHVVLMANKWAIPAGLVLILEVLSWLKVWWEKRGVSGVAKTELSENS